MSWARAWAAWRKHEAGYAPPKGGSGETIGGIDRRYNPHWEGWQKFEILKRTGDSRVFDRRRIHPELAPLVESYMKERYWDAVRGDELPPLIAWAVFDHAGHLSPRAAAKSLQRAIGAAPDGQVGPQTLRRAHQVAEEQGQKHVANAVLRDRVKGQVRAWTRQINKLVARGGTVHDTRNVWAMRGYINRWLELCAAINAARG